MKKIPMASVYPMHEATFLDAEETGRIEETGGEMTEKNQ
jgi:hypothetical protein